MNCVYDKIIILNVNWYVFYVFDVLGDYYIVLNISKFVYDN